MTLSALLLSAGASLAAAAEEPVARNDWWLECHAQSDSSERCAARSASRDGVFLSLFERNEATYVALQAEPGIQFDRSQPVSVRVDDGERFIAFPQRRRVAYIGGADALRLAQQLGQAQAADVHYRDLFGVLRQARFPLGGFAESRQALRSAVATGKVALPVEDGAVSSWFDEMGSWFGRLLNR